MATTSTPLWKASAMRILESDRWPMINFPMARSKDQKECGQGHLLTLFKLVGMVFGDIHFFR